MVDEASRFRVQKNERRVARDADQRVGLVRKGRVALVDALILNGLAASKRRYWELHSIMRSQKRFFGL